MIASFPSAVFTSVPLHGPIHVWTIRSLYWLHWLQRGTCGDAMTPIICSPAPNCCRTTPCCVVVILKQDVAFHEHTLVFVDRVGDTTKSALLNEPGDFFDGSWGLRIRHAHRCERNGDDEKQAHVASSLNGTRL